MTDPNGGGGPIERDPLETYAEVTAAMSGGASREEALARHGLDEAEFDRLEAAALRELEGGDDPGEDANAHIPPSIAGLDRAFRRAQRESSAPRMTFEQFAAATAAAQDGGKVHERFEKMGVVLGEFLRASEHYISAMTKDPALAARFAELVRTARRPR